MRKRNQRNDRSSYEEPRFRYTSERQYRKSTIVARTSVLDLPTLTVYRNVTTISNRRRAAYTKDDDDYQNVFHILPNSVLIRTFRITRFLITLELCSLNHKNPAITIGCDAIANCLNAVKRSVLYNSWRVVIYWMTTRYLIIKKIVAGAVRKRGRFC